MERIYRKSTKVFASDGVIIKGKSETIPDLAPSMRELLVRHASGITDNVNHNLSYSGDLPDLRGVEPHELSAMIYQNQNRLAEMQELMNQQVIVEREQRSKEARERAKKLFESFIKEEENE